MIRPVAASAQDAISTMPEPVCRAGVYCTPSDITDKALTDRFAKPFAAVAVKTEGRFQPSAISSRTGRGRIVSCECFVCLANRYTCAKYRTSHPETCLGLDAKDGFPGETVQFFRLDQIGCSPFVAESRICHCRVPVSRI